MALLATELATSRLRRFTSVVNKFYPFFQSFFLIRQFSSGSFIAEGVYHRVAALHHSGFCRILNVRGSNCCHQTGSDTTTSIVDPYFPLALLSS